MHRAFTERGQDRRIADYVIDADAASSPIIGRLVATGLHDELTGEAYAVIDTDGPRPPRALARNATSIAR
jgi:type IV secretory pathway VirD2 relaxase